MDNQQKSLEGDLFWIGGIIDGEGMITAMTRNERGRKEHAYIPRISIVNTNQTMIDECSRILKDNNIPIYIQTKEGKGTWKTKIELIISGFKRVSFALPILMPYIRVKRPQATLLLQLCTVRLLTSRQPYTPQEHQMVTELRRYNKGGDL